jgi:hypothetical protein
MYVCENLDKPMVTVPFYLSHFRLYDSAKITCQVCSVPSTTIFDFFRPKQGIPIMKGVKEKYDEFVNQTCTKLIITIYVRFNYLFIIQKKTKFAIFQLNHTSLFGPYVCRARNSLGVNHAEFVLKGRRQDY